jgi:hypothetical protein
VGLDSLKKVAEALGLQYESLGDVAIDRLNRIASKLTRKVSETGFENDVLEAEKEINEAGGRALFGSLVQCQVIESPPERQYKIKRVAKGTRIKEKSVSGKNFAFGPVWCEAIKACKSLALNENNREKLNMHGSTVGIEHPEKMAPRELCIAIAARME